MNERIEWVEVEAVPEAVKTFVACVGGKPYTGEVVDQDDWGADD